MEQHLKLKEKSLTEIQYFYISKSFEFISPVLPPEEFDNEIITFLKYCPKDILQLNEAVTYYELIVKKGIYRPYDFNIIYDVNFKDYYKLIPRLKQIRLFFIDAKSSLFKRNFDYLKSIHCPSHFYYIINNLNNIDTENTVLNPNDFIFTLIQNQKKILSYLDYNDYAFSPVISLEYKKMIDFNVFIPTRNNFCLFNSLIGNFGSDDLDAQNISLKNEKAKNISIKAHKDPYSFDRQNLLVEQIKKLDFFLNIGLTNRIFSLPNGIEPQLSPLFLIAPFNNPELDKFHSLPKTNETKEMLSVFQSEQTQNYIAYRENCGYDKLTIGAKYSINLFKYLDDVAFLHASITFSPIIRLPVKGKSIYRELSFFRTNAFAHLNNPNNRKNLRKTIEKFSKIYKKVSISPLLQKNIKSRNSQIILLSDLPLEWLSIDDVPISFTHDVCRLPMTSLHGLMSLFAIHNQFEFIIPKNIIKKTLVIFGSNEPNFKIWQDQCNKLSLEKDFKTELCLTILEVENAIKRHNPMFLIFDCHGSYKEDIKSTILWIGNEELTPDVIVKRNLSAPLVFLSACGTAPTYGVINSIANAFFEAGSLSVTATYLPVEISSSSILYLRLLNKLDMASQNGLHKNWLEFLSHIIRSSYVMEKFLIALSKVKNDKEQILIKNNTAVLQDLLFFKKRRQIFETIDSKLANICKTTPEVFNKSIPEYLFYSNLGRSDLINFESWIEKQKNLNE